MLQENFPYGMVSRGQMHNKFSLQMLMAAYRAGDTTLADKITRSVKKDLEQQLNYMNSLDEEKQAAILGYDGSDVERLLMGIQQIEMQYKKPDELPKTELPAPIKSMPVPNLKAADSPKKKG
jgi:hypothetical protein